MENYCQCGCNTAIPMLDNKGRPRRYVVGHGHILKSKRWVKPKVKKCSRCKRVLDTDKHFNMRQYISKLSGCRLPRLKSMCKDCEKIERSKRDKNKINEQRKILRHSIRDNNDFVSYIKGRIHSFRTRAKKVNVPFDLTYKYLIELYEKQEGLCYFTKEKLLLSNIHGHSNNISLDRLYPEKGYVIGNVVWCSYFSNTMKGQLNIDEFRSLIKIILDTTNDPPVI